MGTFATITDEAFDRLAGRRFDPRLVGGNVIDTGALAERARGLARRLNSVRSGRPKEPVVLWTSGYSAVTRRGPWVYVARGLASRLSDEALAFVLGHEMAHHDLRHLSMPLVVASVMGHSQRMELMADAYGVQLLHRAGFAAEGALEAFGEDLWVEEPEDTLEGWPEPLAEWLDRFRRSHPPMHVRRDALRVAIDACSSRT